MTMSCSGVRDTATLEDVDSLVEVANGDLLLARPYLRNERWLGLVAWPLVMSDTEFHADASKIVARAPPRPHVS
jgi:hypothetical protein